MLRSSVFLLQERKTMKELFSDTAQSGRRVIVLVLVVGLVIGSVGVVAGLSMTKLTAEQIQLWESGTTDSNFNIESYDTHVKGRNTVDVSTELQNKDSSAHEAQVTVQLLDSNGDEIASKTKPTGSVSGSGTVSLDYSFDQSASDYHESFIAVNQTS